MSTKEYADLRDVSTASVRLAIKRAMAKGQTAKLPGVISYKKLARDWVFNVDKKYFAKSLAVT